MTSEVSVLGLGYVGLCTAACFASRGVNVIGVDIDKNRINNISAGRSPFYERDLDSMLKASLIQDRLKLTTDTEAAVRESFISFITVGTPSGPDGQIDLQHVKSVSKDIGHALRRRASYHLTVVKSTVPPRTTRGIVRAILEEYSGRSGSGGFGLCVNPEFLREGSAIHDTLNPDRVVIGEIDTKSGDALESFYRTFLQDPIPPVMRTTPENAELVKYASNAFLATKVSFINMIAALCQELPNTDVEIVAKGIGLDRRIGSEFLKAGAGWGGSCWPKDLKGLTLFAGELGARLPIVESTIQVNDLQPYLVVDLTRKLVGSLRHNRIAVLGLSFKPGTDDVRNAVSLKIIGKLLEEGARVTVFDPVAMDNARLVLGKQVTYANSASGALEGAQCAILVTEWDVFKELRPQDFVRNMKTPCVVDGRRIFSPKEFSSRLKFAAVGLGSTAEGNPAQLLMPGHS